MRKFCPRYLQLLLLPLAVLSLIIFTGNAALADFQESNGRITIEAEDYHSQSNNGVRTWYRYPGSAAKSPDPDGVHQSGASGGKYVEILPDKRVYHNDPLVYNNHLFLTGNNAPKLNYRVNVKNAGRYYIRVRMYSTGAEDNSVHFGVNGSFPESASKAQLCTRNQWVWTGARRTSTQHCGVYNALYIDLKSGTQTIQMAMREDGVEVDKFILTKDKSYFPSGSGSSGSSDTGGTSNSAPNVNAGADKTTSVGKSLWIGGSASDDGIPNKTLTYKWTKVSGPGIADFVSNVKAATSVSFNRVGAYVLQLTANDGELSGSDKIGITVNSGSGSSSDDESSGDSTGSGSQVTVGSGETVIEAEKYNTKTSRSSRSWSSVTKAGVSGMKATPDSGARVASGYTSNSPMMKFNMNFGSTGTYYLWVNGYAVSNGNSFHVGFDGKVNTNSENMLLTKKNCWSWTGKRANGNRAKIIVTKSGSHTLEIYMREDGAAINKLLLVKSSSYTPSGTGTDDDSSDGSSSDTTTSSGKAFQQVSSNGLVVMQAENRNACTERKNHEWVPVTQSGVKAMEVVPDSGARVGTGYASGSPYMQFEVNFIKTGTHYVWLRANCLGNDNSAHVGLGNTMPASGNNITLQTKKGWVWSGERANGQRASINVTKTGIQMVRVYMREDGMICDKIVLSTSAGYRPSGSGPAESARK